MDRIKTLLKTYTFGDMAVNYMLDNENQVTMNLVPEGLLGKLTYEDKDFHAESLVQAKLLGDAYPGAYAQGVTMRNSETAERLRFLKQDEINEGKKATVLTTLTDERGHLFIHKLSYTEGDYALESRTEFVNEAEDTAVLEYITSFSLADISPVLGGESTNALNIHRIRSKWSHEGRLATEDINDLLLEEAWSTWQPNSVRYGSVGSMPVKEFAPFGAAEDRINGILWGASLFIETSWEMEFYRRDSGLCFSGGLADREKGHWMKEVHPGERFETPMALITVCEGNIDYLSQRLTAYNNKFLENIPESEQTLPVLFNEYCTTWGLPSHENIMKITDAVKGRGIEYFVIDCGWFVEEGKHWGDGMGDYIPSDKLFPRGLKYTVDEIKKKGFKPGIWFEIDNIGHDAHVYDNEELLLKRDGIPLTTGNRRFFDMRKKEVINYLDERVLNCLKENGFEYMKMDYNDNIGIGCDGAESLGEGLRLDREASLAYIRHIKEEMPQLVLENCASGGHKLEPLMMSMCAMASFSDAHETELIPVIAARLHRMILPRQSQIWAVIREDDTLKRIAYTLINTFLGRMCFSGDVLKLSSGQWDKIDEGIAFYKKISDVIKNGYTYFYDNYGSSEKYLTGYQAIVRVKNDGKTLIPEKADEAYAVVHIFNDVPGYDGSISIELPESCPNGITDVYSGSDIKVSLNGKRLIVTPSGKMEAVAVRFALSRTI